MNRYIDVDVLLNPDNILVVQDETGIDELPYTYTNAVKVETILKAPTADVIEVRHGENITEMHPVDEFICSECGLIARECHRYEIDPDDGDEICYEFEYRYCPRCGAKIDG